MAHYDQEPTEELVQAGRYVALSVASAIACVTKTNLRTTRRSTTTFATYCRRKSRFSRYREREKKKRARWLRFTLKRGRNQLGLHSFDTTKTKIENRDDGLLATVVSCSACADWPRARALNIPACSSTQVTPGYDTERLLTRERNFYTHTAPVGARPALSQLRETRALARRGEKNN